MKDNQIVDRRTDEERETHPLLVVAHDKFLSGWGLASGGRSLCAWACREDDVDAVESWVRGRSEMRRVRVLDFTYRPRLGPRDHWSVYVVRDGHPALANR
jgi:hypothetical protein